ncbi:hypothetical protein PMPD1_1864 [Paramixta manurensis]|uniref:CdiI immunity protein domain-containing protein n=1 Tax=Paramixta manurensis TaxID=2740817 RepID=A0A6M8UB88_9GAMM|nr:hypothetical protein PMPD1_1864 [Erwiniaceae bacterium PD-1]
MIPITPELDLCILGTFNQDFDVITGANTIEEAIEVYVNESTDEDLQLLKKDIEIFLTHDENEIKKEFSERWPNDISPEFAKEFLALFYASINRKETL